MSRSYRSPFAAVTGAKSAADDKRQAARGVRRKQNQWLRKTPDFDEAIVPHRLESLGMRCTAGADGGQHFQVPDDRDWSRHCLQQNGLDPYESSRWRDRNEWPPRWYVRLQRK